MQRSTDNRNAAVPYDQHKQDEQKAATVNEVDQQEAMSELNEDTPKKREEERKRKERQKQIARQLVRDTGHIIDLEA